MDAKVNLVRDFLIEVSDLVYKGFKTFFNE